MADKKNQDRLKLSEDPAANLPLVKVNFIMMAIAGALIVLGFLLMLGSDSGDTFNPDIFSTRRRKEESRPLRAAVWVSSMRRPP